MKYPYRRCLPAQIGEVEGGDLLPAGAAQALDEAGGEGEARCVVVVDR